MRLCRLLFSVLLIAFCAGCGQSEPAKSSPGATAVKKRGTIGVSVLTLTNPFFKVIADSITTEAATLGYDVIAVSGDFDVAKQQNQVKDFIVKKVSAIVLCPCDSKSIGPVIQEANAAGIPVFTCDIKCLAPDAKVISHIATDNYQGGKLAGEAVIEALGEGGGKIVVLDFKQAESCILRVKGFKEVLEAHNAKAGKNKIDIVAELPGDGQKDRAFKAAEDALQAHGDLAAFFAINDPSALGARAAVEKAGKSGQVKIIGFDGQPEGKQAIRDGKLYADPVQFPERIGTETMRTIAKHFEGEKVPTDILIPTALYRKADADKDPTLK